MPAHQPKNSPDDANAKAPRASPVLNRTEQYSIAGFVLLAILSLGGCWLMDRSRTIDIDNAAPQPARFLVHINTAGAGELSQLPAIAETLAARIIAYRQQNGPFDNVEQLMDVPGIGEKKFAALRKYVTVDDD